MHVNEAVMTTPIFDDELFAIDVPTLETIAAAAWLRSHAPALRLRVVNVVDLMRLFSPRVAEHLDDLPEIRDWTWTGG